MYKSLRACANDLEHSGQLLRIRDEVDPNLEMAEIHRRIFAQGGPAILFENVKGSPFQAISNLYGSKERIHYLFRHTIRKIERVIQLKLDPSLVLKKPITGLKAAVAASTGLPKRTRHKGAIGFGKTTIDKLPQIISWPMDGGSFITLPQVLTLAPGSRNLMQSNLGMYRIQMSGNEYLPNQEVGMHYQLHRGIGVHHSAFNSVDDPFLCSIFVGGPPSHAFSAIMPLPEGLSELTFAGMLGGRRFRYHWNNNFVISNDADFCITGEIIKQSKKPEGPFGDHLGYYSLKHDFPYLKVDAVYHRKDPLWHFTVVGRPPQEDSFFGMLIHDLVKELTPQEFPGLVELNAVDAAGVHPLLLAIGKERYMPFRDQKPEEILTIANRILGTGQTSLAKFLFIAAQDEYPDLNTHDIGGYLQHVLERVNWNRDLHFQTNTTIDTLDYSGSGWNAGSKLVVACRGAKHRNLGTEIPSLHWPPEVKNIKIPLPGILCLQIKTYQNHQSTLETIQALNRHIDPTLMETFPLLVLVDDADFAAHNLANFLWVTFTRSNPATDVHGIQSATIHKHWGCQGPLIIDARNKPHHAPELETDPKVSAKVDQLFKKNGLTNY